MKKKTIILSTILLFFIYIMPIKAESIFKYDWKTSNEYLAADYTMYYNNNTYYDKGYITTTINLDDQDSNGIPKTYIKKYNINGQLENTKILENQMVLAITSNDNYAIALTVSYGNTTDSFSITLLDQNLNVVKDIHISMTENEELYYILEECKILGIDFLTIQDNKAYILTNDYIKEINLDTSSTKNIDPTENNVKIYLPHLFRLSEEKTDTKIYFGYKSKDNKEVFTGIDNQGCVQVPVSEEVGGTLEDSIFSRYPIFTDAFIAPMISCDPDYKGIIKLYNNNELVFDKTYEEYSIFSTPKIINDYIVTIGTKISEDSYEYLVEIVILDMSGNILQTIKEEEYYIGLAEGPTSFITMGVNESSNDRCYGEEKNISYNCFKNNNIVYYLPLTISTKITGAGTIEVKDNARFEETIKYIPIPDKNYYLSNLSIIDSKGNEVSYNNNTFIMPSNDVTIVAIFDVENPNTKDISTIGLILILIASGTFLIKYYLKKRISIK